MAVTVIFSLALGTFFLTRPKEPTYQGKTVTEWLNGMYGYRTIAEPDKYLRKGNLYLRCGVGGEMSGIADVDGVTTFRAIGSNAVPVLLGLISTTEGNLKFKLKNLVNNQSLIKARISTAADVRSLGETGFFILGDKARSATPELLKLTNHREAVVRGSALYCLSAVHAINEVFLPVLQQRLLDTNPGVRLEAAFFLSDSYPSDAERLGVFTTYPMLRNTNSHSTVTITAPISKWK